MINIPSNQFYYIIVRSAIQKNKITANNNIKYFYLRDFIPNIKMNTFC